MASAIVALVRRFSFAISGLGLVVMGAKAALPLNPKF